MSENEKLREALEAWSKSIIMSDGEREIPIADIWAGYGGDVQHAAKLTREALSTPPSKADADDLERIKHMVDRFLMWRLPPDFAPDGGVIFSHTSGGRVNEPIGTNLLTAVQAEAMVRFMVEGLPAIQNRDAGLREALEPYSNCDGDLPDYDSPLRGVFESGVQYAVDLLAKTLDVTEFRYCDGTEEFDGDLAGTMFNIVLAAMPTDAGGDPLHPSEVRALTSANNDLLEALRPICEIINYHGSVEAPSKLRPGDLDRAASAYKNAGGR